MGGLKWVLDPCPTVTIGGVNKEKVFVVPQGEILGENYKERV